MYTLGNGKVAFHTNQQQQPKWKAPVMTSPHQSVTTGMSLGGTSPFKSHALLSRQSNGLILSWFKVYGSCYWLEGRLSGLHPFRQWKMSSLIIPLQNLDWLGGRIRHCLGRGGWWLGKYIKVHENNIFYLAWENLFFIWLEKGVITSGGLSATSWSGNRLTRIVCVDFDQLQSCYEETVTSRVPLAHFCKQGECFGSTAVHLITIFHRYFFPTLASSLLLLLHRSHCRHKCVLSVECSCAYNPWCRFTTIRRWREIPEKK